MGSKNDTKTSNQVSTTNTSSDAQSQAQSLANTNSATNSALTTQPNDPALTAAYGGLLSSAQSVANNPLQLYNGQLVAGLTPDQQAAIGQISGAGGLATPFLTSAANYATQGATPLSASPVSVTPFNQANLSQYYSPYQNDVVNSTMALENQQDAEQQTGLAGNITAAGGWGGDRASVLQAQLARNQTLANNSTNANLENQGYQTALGQFNAQNQLGLTAGTTNAQLGLQAAQLNNQNSAATGYELGNIGQSLQNSALTSGQALLGAGGLEQSVNQAQLNVPYEQYLQQQQYPYQNLNFLSSILPGVLQGTGQTTTGSNTGSSTGTNYSTNQGTNTSNQSGNTTGTATQPGADPTSQILGLATAALPFLKSGGRAHLAGGGLSLGGGYNDPILDYGQSYVPTATPPSGNPMPQSAGSGASNGLESAATGQPPALMAAPSVNTPNIISTGGGEGGSGGSTGGQGSSPSLASSVTGFGNALQSAFDPLGPVTVTPQVTADGGFLGGIGNSGFLGLGGTGGLFDSIGSAASGAGDFLADLLPEALDFLKTGGRARLADGGSDDGTSDFQALLDSLYPTSAPAAAPADTGNATLSAPPPAPAGATAMSLADTPAAWRDQATHFAPAANASGLAGDPESVTDAAAGPSLSNAPMAATAPQAAAQPTWDDGTPVSPNPESGHQFGAGDVWMPPGTKPSTGSMADGWGVQQPAHVMPQIYKPTPDWRRALVTAGLAMAAGRSPHALSNIAGGLQAGAQDYYGQEDKDNHPEVDHSGPTSVIRYADGTMVDTGIPTEAAINAKAVNENKSADLQIRREADNSARLDRENRIDVARINAGLPPIYGTYTTGAGQQAPSGGSAPASNANLPLGIRSNNPGNLQPGGKEATYANQTAGVLAASQNLDSYASQGINTVAGIVSKWAPPKDATGKPINDTPAYIQAVSSDLGVDPSAPLNLKDPNVKGALLEAMFHHENGSAAPSAGGQPQGAPAPAPPVLGKMSAPVTLSIPDGKGGTKQVLAQQSKITGGWYTADQNRSPINATDMHVLTPSAAAQAGNSNIQLTPQTVSDMAAQYLAGDHTVLTSLGYGSQGANNRALVRNEISSQMHKSGATGQQVAERLATFNKSAGAFANGQDGKTITAYNNFLQHSNVLRDLVFSMQNGNVQLINKAKNAFEVAFGEPAPNSFEGVRDLVSDEGVKAILGGAGALGDRDSFKNTISRAGSPQQIYDMLGNYQKLGAGQLYSLETKYKHNTGLSDFPDMLVPDAQRIYSQYKQAGAGQTGSGGQKFQNGKIYKDAKGNRARYDNGQWQPVGP